MEPQLEAFVPTVMDDMWNEEEQKPSKKHHDLLKKEIPYCSACLIICALLCHTGVLIGNLSTAKTMRSTASSVNGWANFAMGIAHSLNTEFDEKMTELQHKLVESVDKTFHVEQRIDDVLSTIGNATQDVVYGDDYYYSPFSGLQTGSSVSLSRHHKPVSEANSSNLSNASKASNATEANSSNLSNASNANDRIHILRELLTRSLGHVMNETLQVIFKEVNEFYQKLKPVMEKVGEWSAKFSPKIVNTVDDFSTSLDKATDIMDIIVSWVKEGEAEEDMIHETFNLFDVSNTGGITAQDLLDCARIYSITPLDGQKSVELFDKYDFNEDGYISKREFRFLVRDETIPQIMAKVLRSYTQKLLDVAGNVGKATMRDEISIWVSRYVQLVVSKNMTKVNWMAEAFTNKSLPTEFVSDVLAELVFSEDDPSVLTSANIGETIVGAMYALNSTNTLAVLNRMKDSEYWLHEGYDPADQANVVERVTEWVVSAQQKVLNAAEVDRVSLLDVYETVVGKSAVHSRAKLGQSMSKAMGDMAHQATQKRMQAHLDMRYQADKMRMKSLYHSSTAKALKLHLLGGQPARKPSQFPSAADLMVRNGAKAANVTLRWAQWLQANTTQVGHHFTKLSMLYTGQSKDALTSFGANLQALTRKLTSFLDTMQRASTPEKMKQYEDKIQNFIDHGAEQLYDLLMKQVYSYSDKLENITEDRIYHSIDKVGDEMSDEIAQRIGHTLGEAIADPAKEAITNYTGNAAVGQLLADFLSPRLDYFVHNVGSKAIGDYVTKALRDIYNKTLDEVVNNANDTLTRAIGSYDKVLEKYSFLQTLHALHKDPSGSTDNSNATQTLKNDAMAKIVEMIGQVKNLLPNALTTLKSARSEVPAFIQNVEATFKNYVEHAPQSLEMSSAFWQSFWTCNFILNGVILCFLAYYVLWASGWFGGPQAEKMKFIPTPVTYADYARCFCSSCSTCLKEFHDMSLCFWSLIIIWETLVVFLFATSMFLCAIGVFKTLLDTGCGEVHILQDDTVCNSNLQTVGKFIETLMVGESDPENACVEQKLPVCSVINKEMYRSVLLTTTCSVAAAILTVQMLIDTAVLHEKAKFRRMIDRMIKEEESDMDNEKLANPSNNPDEIVAGEANEVDEMQEPDAHAKGKATGKATLSACFPGRQMMGRRQDRREALLPPIVPTVPAGSARSS